jgi:uncharacterized membrane protein YbhN (UPF0104 family)
MPAGPPPDVRQPVQLAIGMLVACAVLGIAVLHRGNIAAGSNSLASADREWLLLAAAASAGLWLAGAASQLGAISIRPPLGRLVAVQVAASFANHVLPAGVGGMTVNVRFLRRQGLSSASALGAVAVCATATGLTHALLLGAAFLAAPAVLARLASLAHLDRAAAGLAAVDSNVHWFEAAAAGSVIVALLVVARSRNTRTASMNPGRAARAAGWFRGEARALRVVLRDPRRAAQLWLGTSSSALLHGIALVAVVRSLTPAVAVTSTLLVYLGASALSALIPAPGAIGPLDVMLVGGLTGLGLPATTAVAAVLGYRLVTVWVPLVPTAIIFAELVRRKII